MHVSQEDEDFLKELARRLKAQNISPENSISTQNQNLVFLIQTETGKVFVSVQEKNKLEDIVTRTGTSGPELISQYVREVS